MTDELRKVYEAAGRIAFFFQEAVPRDLFRGQSRSDQRSGTSLLAPNPGFTRKDGSVRLPDIKIDDVDGKQIVRGCRTTHGDYRGISVFDRPTAMTGFRWFRLQKGVKIPEALAITQDGDFPDRANHYTIAPKDDMTLELFLAWLKVLEREMTESD